MNPIFKDLEIKQRKIDASHGADCVGKLRKIVDGCANWDIYYHPGGYCLSIAKPASGAADSIYGDLKHIKRQVAAGVIRKSQLTKLGRRLLND